MRRGTTPTLIFKVKGLDNDCVDKMYFSLKQGNKILTKEDYTFEDNKYYVKLSQEETLMFLPKQLFVQIKIKTTNGEVIASPIKQTTMDDILSEEVV